MNKLTRLSILCCLALFTSRFSFAQEYNPIPVAMPSLLFTPDARGGGMGDIGVSTTPDVYSQHWNAAKYPFISTTAGFSFSYTPWLTKLVDDIHLLYASGYWKIGKDDVHAVSASLRYFSLGDIDYYAQNADLLTTVSPNEFAFDVAYSRKLTETFSGAVVLRYIHANYSTGSDDTSPGNAFSLDLAGYNQSNLMLGRYETLLGLGFNLSNIGTKISYDGGNTSMFLPANMRLGASLGLPLDSKNMLSFSLDFNKLLVPTPKLPAEGETSEQAQKRVKDYNNISSIGGIFRSFGDAPGGFKEEMQEIIWSLGAEYTYNNQFSFRSGYFHESAYKGSRRYLTFGAGINMHGFQLDAAYLISTSQSNPLDQTLRVSLGVDIDGIRRLMQ